MTIDTKESKKERERERLGISEKTGTNILTEVLQFKVVYWGPGESGKTTNYFRLREKLNI